MSFEANAESVALPETPAESCDDSEKAKAISLKNRLASTREQAMQEKEDPGQLTGCETTDSPMGGNGKPDLLYVEHASQHEDSSLRERCIHSPTPSVTDEWKRPTSEVENGAHVDESAHFSSRSSISVSPPTAEKEMGQQLHEEDRNVVVRGSELGLNDFEGAQERVSDLEEDHDVVRGSELEGDDFEGADGEIDSVSGGQSREPLSEEPRRRILSSDGRRLREGDGKELEEFEVEGDGEVIQGVSELQDELRTSESKRIATIGPHYRPQSYSDDLSRSQNNLKATETLNLGTLSTETQLDEDEDKASTQQTRLDLDGALLYPQQLDPEDVINPFSLEVRIRKAREQQDIALGWEAETIAENIVGISLPQFDLGQRNGSILPDLEEMSPDQQMGSSEMVVGNGFYSEVKKRIGTEPPSELLLAENAKEFSAHKTGMGEAVLLGALASGVNKPTWFVIRAVLVGLLASLLLLLHVAHKSGSLFAFVNVLFLISIAGGLILLLAWYISEIGLVSVDKQMAELNLSGEPSKVECKTL